MGFEEGRVYVDDNIYEAQSSPKVRYKITNGRERIEANRRPRAGIG